MEVNQVETGRGQTGKVKVKGAVTQGNRGWGIVV